MAQMMAALMAQADFFSPREFDQLQEHAVEMEMVIVPVRQFDITILSDEVCVCVVCVCVDCYSSYLLFVIYLFPGCV